ncbi:MAG: hypothetical protein KC766_17380, partial [Myxococcales bacterium]|nr:hypothetical protein [Myxococcales bacterium]
MTLGLDLALRRLIPRAVALLPISVLGVSAVSCSDPVPVAAAGNFAVKIAGDAPGAPKRCSLGGGAVFGFGDPTSSEPGDRTSDGDDKVSVSCKVRKSGDHYVISGTVARNADSFFISSDDLDATSNIGSARINAVSGKTIGYSTCTAISCPQVSDPPLCTLEVLKDRAGEAQVKPGAIWAQVTCPMVV